MEPLLIRVFLWLRDRLGVIKEESYNLLEYFFPNIYGAVDAIAGFRPIYFADSNLPRLSFSGVAELYVEEITAQDYGDPMKGIAMPGCSLPRRQPLSPDQVISPMMQHLLIF